MNPLHWIDTWGMASQQRARRNAMVAATALARRRAEIDDVEDFLARVRGGEQAPALRVGAHG